MSDELNTAGLTPEEIEALKFDDGDPNATQGELEDKATAEVATTTTETTNADDASTNEGGDDAGAAAAADDAAAPAAKADDGQPAAADAQPTTTPSAPQAPLLVVQAPADAEAKFKEIADGKAALRKQYDDGDLTFDEYEAKKDALDEQRLELKLQVETANTAQRLEAQRLKNQWDADCNSFLDQHKANYAGDENKEAFAHLNETVIAFAKMPRYANLSGPQLLAKAHAHVSVERGFAAPAPAPKPDGKPSLKSVPKPNLPPDIGGLPAATGNDPGEGKWASLDRLRDSNNGPAFEAALAKMSQADRDAYLAA